MHSVSATAKLLVDRWYSTAKYEGVVCTVTRIHVLSPMSLASTLVYASSNCANYSVCSGALGVMFLEGLGVLRNLDKAFICLKDAVSRGNVYAMGHLIAYYYRCRLYTKAVELAARSQFSFCTSVESTK